MTIIIFKNHFWLYRNWSTTLYDVVSTSNGITLLLIIKSTISGSFTFQFLILFIQCTLLTVFTDFNLCLVSTLYLYLPIFNWNTTIVLLDKNGHYNFFHNGNIDSCSYSILAAVKEYMATTSSFWLIGALSFDRLLLNIAA